MRSQGVQLTVILAAVAALLLLRPRAAWALKPGVVLSGSPQMVKAREIVAGIWEANGYQLTVTSGMDGDHMEGSRHPGGLAEDYRTHDLPDVTTKKRMAQLVRRALGPEYDVILEDLGTTNEHLHVEFDPHKGV